MPLPVVWMLRALGSQLEVEGDVGGSVTGVLLRARPASSIRPPNPSSSQRTLLLVMICLLSLPLFELQSTKVMEIKIFVFL